MIYLLLLIGIALLVKGADYMIDGAVGLAKIFGFSSLFIGLSVTAFGTSAPEAAVSIKAAISSYPSISFGNILGSNIANIGLVIGLGALVWSVQATESTIKKETPFCLFVFILTLFMVRDDWHGKSTMYLSRLDGMILLILFSLYLHYLYSMAKRDRKLFFLNMETQKIKHSQKEILKASALTIVGIVGVLFGAHLIVGNAAIIARRLGVSELLISVTVIAVGTSLPEAATSLSAMKKGEADIAIGNVVGSNVFNILFVLGLTSVLRPIEFPLLAFKDFLTGIGISVVFLLFAYTKSKVTRKEGAMLLLLYIFYIVFVVIRK
ncbi:calcium/sodium antiporter [candidate division WOR-3 bacterium]|nr:calcium/sodium antiporter [candidate division WOR-3 bacterium]